MKATTAGDNYTDKKENKIFLKVIYEEGLPNI